MGGVATVSYVHAYVQTLRLVVGGGAYVPDRLTTLRFDCRCHCCLLSYSTLRLSTAYFLIQRYASALTRRTFVSPLVSGVSDAVMIANGGGSWLVGIHLVSSTYSIWSPPSKFTLPAFGRSVQAYPEHP